MAQLVLKIKHKETLRRWVIPASDGGAPLSFIQLKLKIQELFQFPPNSILSITYVDKEGDVVTVADDQDLVDACVLQGLNPLRLTVELVFHDHHHDAKASTILRKNAPARASDGDSPRPIPPFSPDAMKEHISKFTHALESNLQPGLLLKNIRVAWSEVFKNLSHHGRRVSPPTPSECVGGSGDSSQSESLLNPSQHKSPLIPNPMVHLGVKCDECGMYPVQGLRYRSLNVFNYDLCSGCFGKIGNESDYERIENPILPPWHFCSSPAGKLNFLAKWRTPVASGTDGWKSECPFIQKSSVKPLEIPNNLSSLFVKDMTDHVGKVLFPSTEFIKVWHLRNNGSTSWPHGTRIVNIGGDKMSADDMVLELPHGGLSTGEEFDVVMNFRAPDTPGSYVSHWRLMAPTGEMFGQTLWVALQVSSRPQADDALECVNNAGTITNQKVKEDSFVPYGASQSSEHESLDMDIKPNTISSEQNSDPLNSDAPKIEGDGLYSINEKDGFSIIEKSIHGYMEPTGVFGSHVRPLNELESMGFTNRKLNTMLLAENNGDLQLTLDNLIMASGLDGLLKDLQEMGFEDVDTNLFLLIKNGGSIKRVVKELVEMEKQG